jgi:hypothetical protein
MDGSENISTNGQCCCCKGWGLYTLLIRGKVTGLQAGRRYSQQACSISTTPSANYSRVTTALHQSSQDGAFSVCDTAARC